MEKKFDTLSDYISLAKKTISKFAPKFYKNLPVEMLNNEDAISDVATALMYADWRYDENRTGKTGLKKTQYSYRNQCAIWAIKTYITQKYKTKSSKPEYSLDFESNEKTLNEFIPDTKIKTPLQNVIEKEDLESLSEDVLALISSSYITDKQREQIILYYFKDQTLAQIGKRFSISREAVRQNIKRAFDCIRKYDYSSN
jgi:RNA polymerase sigma factor (sigma-70 family)